MSDSSLSLYDTKDCSVLQDQVILTGDSTVRRQGQEIVCHIDANKRADDNDGDCASLQDQKQSNTDRIDRFGDMIVLKTPTVEICFQGNDYQDEERWMQNLKVSPWT